MNGYGLMSKCRRALWLAWLGLSILSGSVCGCISRPPKLPGQSTSVVAWPASPQMRTDNDPEVPRRIDNVAASNDQEDFNVLLDDQHDSRSSTIRSSTIRSDLPALHRNPNRLEEDYWQLALDEALRMALAEGNVLRDLGGTVVNSPAAAATIWDPMVTDADPLFGPVGSASQYDPRLAGQLFHSKNDRVFNNATLGGGATELQQDLVNGRLGYAQRTWSGATWELNSISTYDANNRVGNLFPSNWEQHLEAGIRQPLLRGAGRRFNAIAGPFAQPGFQFSHGVWIATIRSDISKAEFSSRLQAYLVSVEDAYWQLSLAYQQYQTLRQTTERAEQVYKIVHAKFEAGQEGGEADREAEARSTLMRFRLLQQQALGGGGGFAGIYPAEMTLRRLLGVPADEPRLISPSTPPPMAPVVFDCQAAIQTGLASRPELAQQRLAVRQEELKLIAAKNLALPQVDLYSRYRVRGFGQRWFGDGPRFASAWQEATELNNQEWEFGLDIEAPYRQRQARQGIRFAQHSLARSRAILDEQEATIRYAILEAIARSESNYQALRLASANLEANQQRVAATSAQFDQDRIPLERVRQAQESLQLAADQAATACVEYARALRDVCYQSGRYLHDLSIVLP